MFSKRLISHRSSVLFVLMCILMLIGPAYSKPSLPVNSAVTAGSQPLGKPAFCNTQWMAMF